jgi:hypothetical protein
MAHHKRKRPKNARSGCLLCKPWKANGAKNRDQASVRRVLEGDECDDKACAETDEYD